MHHTISNINKTVELQQYIDNGDENKLVGVKRFTYTLGWYNIIGQDIQIVKERPIQTRDGFCRFQQ